VDELHEFAGTAKITKKIAAVDFSLPRTLPGTFRRVTAQRQKACDSGIQKLADDPRRLLEGGTDAGQMRHCRYLVRTDQPVEYSKRCRPITAGWTVGNRNKLGLDRRQAIDRFKKTRLGCW
jgi:hypothetical protein